MYKKCGGREREERNKKYSRLKQMNRKKVSLVGSKYRRSRKESEVTSSLKLIKWIQSQRVLLGSVRGHLNYNDPGWRGCSAVVTSPG